MIELQHIKKRYTEQDEAVIKDVTVSITPGEFFFMVGPSGSGKSTILRMIAGLESITGGELLIDGERMNDLPPKSRHLSMVFQNYALYPNMTVSENIVFGLKSRKVDRATQFQRLSDALAMVDLTDFSSRYPRELSGGQRQRVALARSIVSGADIILMDEPLSNLDAQLRESMRYEIKALQRKLGITVIYVTHDQTEAMTMGDRVMILNDGIVQQIGTPIQLYQVPENTFVAKFFGTPKMNVIPGVTDWQNHGVAINTPFDPDALVGIRPQAAHVTQENKDDLAISLWLASMTYIGSDTLLFGTINNRDETVQFKIKGMANLSPQQYVTIYVSREDLYYFDLAGQALATVGV
ncbi:ABC transporter ATP-binding protein [Leuconostoc citreum]|uniref:ABC transporter ATP-binding protein n=1 Tax=Leuconostoc citreum TaxID=33964 RepID=UPI0032DEE1F5